MDRRRVLAIVLMVVAGLMIIGVPIWFFSPLSSSFNVQASLVAAPLTPLPLRATPRTTPRPVLVAQGEPGQIQATEALLLDADTDTILYEKHAELPLPMASTTKIMTALIAIQSGNLEQMVTIGKDAVQEVTLNGGSGAGLVAGDQLTLKDLVYGLMLPSGDDAAIAIADALAGSPDAFVTIMNVEAQRLHLYQTRFYNADGLEATNNQGQIIPDVHYTTPYDLARLTRYAMTLPFFAQVVQAKKYTVAASGTNHPYQWTNTNQLLTGYKGTIGVKTGWTPQAGGCVVIAAQRKGHTLISVILDSKDEATRFTDAETLLNWGFNLPVRTPTL